MENNSLLLEGLFYDLDETTKAYEIAGVDKSWIDYTISDNEWNEQAYYDDFNEWWFGLSASERLKIHSELKK